MNRYIQKNNIRTLNNIWNQLYHIDSLKSPSLRWYDMDRDYFDVNEYIDFVEKTDESLRKWGNKEVTERNISLETIEFNNNLGVIPRPLGRKI